MTILFYLFVFICDQPQPGSFLNKREEPWNKVVRYPVSHTAAEGKQKKASRLKR
jgi:hypothetical protein